MADTLPTPRSFTEALAARGLVPAPLTLTKYDATVVDRVRRAYEGYADRATELGMTTAHVAGLARACADIACGQDDEAFVLMLRPLIAAEELTAAETVTRATNLLAYLHAESPAPTA